MCRRKSRKRFQSYCLWYLCFNSKDLLLLFKHICILLLIKFGEINNLSLSPYIHLILSIYLCNSPAFHFSTGTFFLLDKNDSLISLLMSFHFYFPYISLYGVGFWSQLHFCKSIWSWCNLPWSNWDQETACDVCLGVFLCVFVCFSAPSIKWCKFFFESSVLEDSWIDLHTNHSLFVVSVCVLRGISILHLGNVIPCSGRPTHTSFDWAIVLKIAV